MEELFVTSSFIPDLSVLVVNENRDWRLVQY